MTEKVLSIISSSASSNRPIQNENQIMQLLSPVEIDFVMNQAIKENLEDLYSIHVQDHEIKQELMNLLKSSVQWILLASKQGILSLSKHFPVHQSFNQSSIQTAQLNEQQQKYDSRLEKVVSIEESIQSPMLGIKGQIDLIGKGKLFQLNGLNTDMTNEDGNYLLPIEFKTGKWRPGTAIAHRAQVILYILLMNIREKSLSYLRRKTHTLPASITEHNKNTDASGFISSKYGVLLYLSEQQIQVDYIWPNWDEIRSLILARNSLAFALSSSISVNPEITAKLPEMIKSSFECTYCYSASECMIYHSVLENGHAESSGIPMVYQYIMKGISPQHLTYFKKWDSLIDFEGSFIERQFQNNLWNLSSIEREGNGMKSISLLGIKAYQTISIKNEQKKETGASEEEKLEIQFQRFPSLMNIFSMKATNPEQYEKSLQNDLFLQSIQDVLRKDFTASQITIGDRVMISLEKTSSWFHPSSNSSSSSLNRRQSHSGLKGNYFNNPSKAIMSVDANVCSGTVVAMEPSSITISLTSGMKAMKK
jgi:hypothetical protein